LIRSIAASEAQPAGLVGGPRALELDARERHADEFHRGATVVVQVRTQHGAPLRGRGELGGACGQGMEESVRDRREG
jgi:hypothetical protein